jgi:hypothetical protein
MIAMVILSAVTRRDDHQIWRSSPCRSALSPSHETQPRGYVDIDGAFHADGAIECVRAAADRYHPCGRVCLSAMPGCFSGSFTVASRARRSTREPRHGLMQINAPALAPDKWCADVFRSLGPPA